LAVRLPKGLLSTKPVLWTVAAEGGTYEFTLDKKSFGRRGSSKFDVSKYEKDGSSQFQIEIEPGRLVHRVYTGTKWEEADVVEGDFRKPKISFQKDARISTFSFAEK
jgi:hypothetical protein